MGNNLFAQDTSDVMGDGGLAVGVNGVIVFLCNVRNVKLQQGDVHLRLTNPFLVFGFLRGTIIPTVYFTCACWERGTTVLNMQVWHLKISGSQFLNCDNVSVSSLISAVSDQRKLCYRGFLDRKIQNQPNRHAHATQKHWQVSRLCKCWTRVYQYIWVCPNGFWSSLLLVQ